MTTYFRRAEFPMAPNRKPKWHVLANEGVGPYDVTRALCGYSYNFILGRSMRKEGLKTKKLICVDCLKKLEK